MFKRYILVILGLAVAALTFADDLTPPPWRGAPNTTYQHWGFINPIYGLADQFNNPYGPPVAALFGTATYMPTFVGAAGVWELAPTTAGTSSGITFDIPNLEQINFKKEIWLQVTWFGQAPSGTVFANGQMFPIGTSIDSPALTPGWTHSLYKIQLPFQPHFETITIESQSNAAYGPTYVDQVVIDTHCTPVPEPSTWLAICTGVGLTYARMRRRSIR